MRETPPGPPRLWSLSSVEWRHPVHNGSIVLRLWDSQRWETREQSLSWGNIKVQGGPLTPDLQSEAPILLVTGETPFPVMPLQLREQASYRVEVLWEGSSSPPELHCFPALTPPLLRSDPGVRRPHVFSGTLNFRDYVGETALALFSSQRELFRVALEVRSRKIDYIYDYVLLLDDIAGRLASLLLRLDSPVYASFRQGTAASLSVGDELFLVLRHLVRWPALRHAWESLQLQPPEVLARRIHKARTTEHPPRTSRELVTGYRQENSWVKAPSSLQLPAIANQQIPVTYTKQGLGLVVDKEPLLFAGALHERVSLLLHELRERYLSGKRASLVLEVEQLLLEWESLPMSPMLKQVRCQRLVRAPRQRFATDSRLRPMLEAWDILDVSIRLSWKGLADVILGPLRDLATLYEYWCFFALLDALHQIGKPQSQHHRWWNIDGARLQADISREQGFGFRFQTMEVWLFYQRRFSPGQGLLRSYSVPLVPDFSIEVRREGASPVLLCFDAKYRPDQSLEKMHAYRDALRGALGCYVLYPGEEEVPTIFARDKGTMLPGVGAFALRPSTQSQEWLTGFLQWSLEQLAGETNG